MRLSEALHSPSIAHQIDVIGMPEELQGKIFNACSDPCDMLIGPCACGAWHFGEHVERYKEKK